MDSTSYKQFLSQRETAPTLNKWCSADINTVLAQANAEERPVIGIWSNGTNCDYCKKFVGYVQENDFKTWMNTSQCYFCFISVGESGSKEMHEWTAGAGSQRNITFPWCRIHYEKSTAAVKDQYADYKKYPTQKVSQMSQGIADKYKSMLNTLGYDPTATPTKYTVTFNANGGIFQKPDEASRNVEENNPVGGLPTVARDGYTFAGWWTAPDGGTQINESTVITGNITVYARWTAVAPQPPAPVIPPGSDGGKLQTMFGLNRDCTVITGDNKVLLYQAAKRGFTLIGNYTPHAALAYQSKIG